MGDINNIDWSSPKIIVSSRWLCEDVNKINKWFPTSQLCCVCGSDTGKKPVHIRKCDCPECGTKRIFRDVNASINISNYGLRQIDDQYKAGTVGIQTCEASP